MISRCLLHRCCRNAGRARLGRRHWRLMPRPMRLPNKLAREVFKQLIEINTTDSVGNVTTAVGGDGEALPRCRASRPQDVVVLRPD